MNDTCICDNAPKVWRLTGVTRTLRLRIFNPDGTPLDLTGRTVAVTIARDNSEFVYAPGLVIEGDDNNVVKFEWPANQQGAGDYTINVTTTDGSGNVDRVNWHGPTGIRLVDFSFMVRGEDALGVTNEANIGLDGTFTMNGTGMSAYDEWLAEGHTGTPEDFIAWLRQPAEDAATEAEATVDAKMAEVDETMDEVQEQADADHARAEGDHTTAAGDHTRAEADHVQAVTDSQQAATDHHRAEIDAAAAASDREKAATDRTKAANDRQQAAADRETAAQDHATASSDHQQAQSDHSTASADHTQAAQDAEQAASDHTRAGDDHDTAATDHQHAEADHTRAEDDHTTAAADHTTAAADHTQATADHAVMEGYDTRLGNVEDEVSQLGQEVGGNRYLQDATISVLPGYVSGSVGNHYSVQASTTRHYCILPANPGISTVVFRNCTPSQRVNIDEYGNIISIVTPGGNEGLNVRFVAFNFEDADNTYENAKILQSLSLEEQERFSSHDFQCFQRYSTIKDQEFFFNTGKAYSSILRAFLSLKLTGFNKENPHYLRVCGRNEGVNHRYRLIIQEYVNGSWSNAFDASNYNVETGGVQDGVNAVTWVSGEKSVKAIIDYSFIEDNTAPVMAYIAYILKPECFNDFDTLSAEVQSLQENALVKDMLEKSTVSNNIANPDNIEDGKYVNSAGGFTNGEGWSLVSVKVSAGQKITFGGFKLGRGGYYRFESATGGKVSNGSYSDPNFRANPITLDVPATSVLLYIDIASTSSPSDPYADLMVNLGETLLPHDEYQEAVTSINGEPLAGGASKEIEAEIAEIEEQVADLSDQVSVYTSSLIADLPISDGTDIQVGDAYIESVTGAVKVKLS